MYPKKLIFKSPFKSPGVICLKKDTLLGDLRGDGRGKNLGRIKFISPLKSPRRVHFLKLFTLGDLGGDLNLYKCIPGEILMHLAF